MGTHCKVIAHRPAYEITPDVPHLYLI